MRHLLLFLSGVALLAGCATMHEAKMDVLPGVREESTADDALFHDVLTMRGGVGFADSVFYSNATKRTLTNIQVIAPYDNHQIGAERWTVEHEGHVSCNYLVKFIPDGQGGTTFQVRWQP